MKIWTTSYLLTLCFSETEVSVGVTQNDEDVHEITSSLF